MNIPDSSLRVAMDVSAVPDDLTGVGRYCADLLRSFAELDAPSLTLYARRDDGDRWSEFCKGVCEPIIEAVAPVQRPLRLLWGEYVLGSAVARSKPTANAFFGPHYTMPTRLRVPGVVTVHDLTLIEHPEWHERSKVLVFGRAIRRAAREASAIICVSERTKERLLAHVSPKGAVVTIPHGIDHERFRADVQDPQADMDVLARLGVREPYALNLGTIEPRKNQRTVVAAFNEIAPRDRDLSLVFAGGWGWGVDEFKDAVKRSPYRDRIHTLGFVDHGDVAPLLRRASVVVYPSLEEGFGIPALEALACGASLVTTADSAMSEVANGAAITVSDPLDQTALAAAMSEALDGSSDPDRRVRGIAIAKEYSWELSARRHLEVFQSVASQ